MIERFAKIGSATRLAVELRQAGVFTRNGKAANKGFIYKLLTNRLYIGEAGHKGQNCPGEHEAIISKALWDRVHAILATSPRTRAGANRAHTPALLRGMIFGPFGRSDVANPHRKSGRLYRYYVSQSIIKGRRDACPIGRLAAAEFEGVVIAKIRKLLLAPKIIVATWRGKK